MKILFETQDYSNKRAILIIEINCLMYAYEHNVLQDYLQKLGHIL